MSRKAGQEMLKRHISISGKINQKTFLTRQKGLVSLVLFCLVRKVFWLIFPEISIWNRLILGFWKYYGIYLCYIWEPWTFLPTSAQIWHSVFGLWVKMSQKFSQMNFVLACADMEKYLNVTFYLVKLSKLGKFILL